MAEPSSVEMPDSPGFVAQSTPRRRRTLLDTSKASAALKAISKRNAIESPFLRLPAEIRNRIYEYALGGELLHISWAQFTPARETGAAKGRRLALRVRKYSGVKPRKDKALIHCICQAEISEQEAFRRSQDASLDERIKLNLGQEVTEEVRDINYFRMGDEYHIDSCVTRHARCTASLDSRAQQGENPQEDSRPFPHDTLPIGLLRVCRQVYIEARLIPYSTNTFSFSYAVAFSTFLASRHPTQREAIASLHILVRARNVRRPDPITISRDFIAGESLEAWIRTLTAKRIMSLPSLKSLHLSLDAANFKVVDLISIVRAYSSWHGIPSALRHFQRLPLEKVTVILSDDPDWYVEQASMFASSGLFRLPRDTVRYLRDGMCLTAEKKRKWAVRLQKLLLQEWDERQDLEALKAQRREECARREKKRERERSVNARKRYCLRGDIEAES